MIPRRISEHVKAHNWFAVGVDLVIVIVGVFIGIQVSNWNAARLAHVEEKRLIAQLLIDVDRAAESKRGWIANALPRIETLQSALIAIQSGEPDRPLSKDQCTYVALSHIIIFESSSLPTLDEMLATGGLGLISNQKALRALTQYKSDLAEVQAAYNFIRADFANLVDNYGNAFPRVYDPTIAGGESPIPTVIECRIEVIRADPTLRNKIVSNLARTRQLANHVEQEIALLDQIGSELRSATP